MKKFLIIALLAVSAQVDAQIKNVSQLITLSGKTYKQVAASLETGYWKKYEDGKMDSLNYTRWVPAATNDKNIGDNIMCFYQKKEKQINYIVLQTLNTAFRDKCRAEAKKDNYQVLQNEKKKGEVKESYLKGKCNVTIFEGKQNPQDAVSYLIGARMLNKL